MHQHLHQFEGVPNPYVFVVGCPRSGTTLLRRLLDAHELLAIPKAESHWIPKFYRKGEGLTNEGLVTREFLERLFDYPRFQKMGINPQALQSIFKFRPELPYAEFVTQVFNLYGRKHGKQLVGDKTPGYVRFIELLHGLFPDAKFVHLIRDGRDVCLSMLAWSRLHKTAGGINTFEQDPVTSTALYWEWLVRLGMEAGAALPAGYYQPVIYESLVDDTERTSRALCAFLKIPFDRNMLHYHAGRERHDVALSAKKAWLPPTKGLRNWRSQMTEDELFRFEAASGQLLENLGYARSIVDIPQKARQYANTLRCQFNRKPHPLAWQAES